MHAAPHNMQHRRRRVQDLAERAPALINIPFPEPSIPILDPLLDPLLKPLAPLLTPIIDFKHSSTSTPASHPTTISPPQAPTPNPTTAVPSPSPPSSTPSNGSDPSSGNGSGGSQGNSGSGSSNGSGSGNSATSDSGTGDSGSSPSNGGDSGSSPDSPSNGASNAPAPNGPAASSPSESVPNATSTVAASPGSAGSALSDVPGSNGQPASGSNDSAGSAPGATLAPIINANGAAFVSGATSVLLPGQPGYDAHTTGVPTANVATPTDVDGIQGAGMTSGSSGISQTGAGSSSTANHADPSGPSRANGDGSHHGLSAGIIAAISIIIALLFLVLLMFFCRKRAVALRLRRRRNWFAAGSYNRGVGVDDYRDGGNGGTKSARSSFATNIDRGQMFTPTPSLDLLPPMKDMSQVWPSNLNGSITVVPVPPASHTVHSTPSPTIRAAPDRTSLSSLSSSGSASGGDHVRPFSQMSQYQHLTLPGAAATEASPYVRDFPSPFSVRPFSPSETFSFPRPPQDDARSRASEMMTGSIMSASLASAAFFTAEDHPISSPASSPEPRLGAEENPFLDFTEITTTTGRPPTASTESSAHFALIETICRPFVPTMDDEIAVRPGEDVRILKRFDDGWAYAENATTGAEGLIPIDCLRPVEEDLPAFLAKKRLSSYVPGPASVQERRATLMSQRTSALSGTSVGKAM